VRSNGRPRSVSARAECASAIANRPKAT
jgi:hypothetical protein